MKSYLPKRKGLSSNHPFSFALAVSFREGWFPSKDLTSSDLLYIQKNPTNLNWKVFNPQPVATLCSGKLPSFAEFAHHDSHQPSFLAWRTEETAPRLPGFSESAVLIIQISKNIYIYYINSTYVLLHTHIYIYMYCDLKKYIYIYISYIFIIYIYIYYTYKYIIIHTYLLPFLYLLQKLHVNIPVHITLPRQKNNTAPSA